MGGIQCNLSLTTAGCKHITAIYIYSVFIIARSIAYNATRKDYLTDCLFTYSCRMVGIIFHVCKMVLANFGRTYSSQ